MWAFVAEFENGGNQMISGGFEGDLIYCELKCRGCNPDTITADGKADRNLRGLYSYGQRGCKFSLFEISGLYQQKSTKIQHL